MGPYRSLCVLMCPYVFLQILMRYYRSLCVFMGVFRFLYVVVCFMFLWGSLWVLLCPCWSFQILTSSNASLWVLIEKPSRFYRVIRGPYKSLCVFMGPSRSL